ncbi:histone-fold-containing protein, partial [Jaminaea rosea]
LRASRKPGTSQLPTARVKKIILSDPDVDACGKEATFAIGKACEIYIHHLVESAYTQARLDKRKAVVYRDVSRAIKSTPHLEFLMDVVPQSIPLSQALTERQR